MKKTTGDVKTQRGGIRTSFAMSPVPTIVKYAFSLVLALFAFSRVSNPASLFLSLLELSLVFLMCNALASWSRVAASVLSGVLLLFYDLQQLLLVFANSFLTLVMVTNLDSLEDISGKMFVYGGAALAMLVILALPVRHININFSATAFHLGGLGMVLFLLFSVEAVSLEVLGLESSPYFSYVTLMSQHAETVIVAEEIKKQPNTTLEFYRASSGDYIAKPQTLPERPNIVVIFTEGLSQHIVDDERGIMPNVAQYQQASLSFSSYFNHTFATYRGLTGQMHSGYQHDNYDDNTLVSFAEILADQGYDTAFINTEPGNQDFFAYLHTLGFSNVLNYPDEEHHGMVGNDLSDREGYEKLFDEMSARHNATAPFFLGIYTFGTHASLDSADEKFGYGNDSELNKFYDADYQFGEFMRKFQESDMFNDTIIFFTADHCTYGDMYFSNAFPNYDRAHVEVDSIPLFIYHKDVEPTVIDVQGRNTLGLAPTVLDYLDIDAPNYFLGTSLFAPESEATEYDYYFSDGGSAALSTKNGYIHRFSANKEAELKKLLWRYYAAKQQEPLTPDAV